MDSPALTAAKATLNNLVNALAAAQAQLEKEKSDIAQSVYNAKLDRYVSPLHGQVTIAQHNSYAANINNVLGPAVVNAQQAVKDQTTLVATLQQQEINSDPTLLSANSKAKNYKTVLIWSIIIILVLVGLWAWNKYFRNKS